MEFEKLISSVDQISSDEVASQGNQLTFSRCPEYVAESKPKLICPKYKNYQFSKVAIIGILIVFQELFSYYSFDFSRTMILKFSSIPSNILQAIYYLFVVVEMTVINICCVRVPDRSLITASSVFALLSCCFSFVIVSVIAINSSSDTSVESLSTGDVVVLMIYGFLAILMASLADSALSVGSFSYVMNYFHKDGQNGLLLSMFLGFFVLGENTYKIIAGLGLAWECELILVLGVLAQVIEILVIRYVVPVSNFEIDAVEISNLQDILKPQILDTMMLTTIQSTSSQTDSYRRRTYSEDKERDVDRDELKMATYDLNMVQQNATKKKAKGKEAHKYSPTKRSGWCQFYLFVLFGTYSGAVIFALSTLVVSYQVQCNSYMAALQNFNISEQYMIGDDGEVFKGYSGSLMYLQVICDLVFKIVVLVVIGYLYDCVSYDVLKKVQFMQVIMISLSFIIFSIPVFIGIENGAQQTVFFISLSLLYSPCLFIQWDAPLRLFIGGKRAVVCIIYSVKYLVYAVLLFFDSYFAIARTGIIQIILLVIGNVSIYMMTKRIQMDENQ